MSNKFRDFDEFFKEMDQNEECLEIKLFDKVYKIKKDLPASAFLEIHRAAKNGDAEFSDEKQIEMAMLMLGEENVTEWCEKGLTLVKLGEIMKWVAEALKSDAPSTGGSTTEKK
jgi:hypothetical protein